MGGELQAVHPAVGLDMGQYHHYHCHHHHYQRVQLFAKRMQRRKIITGLAPQLKEVNRHPWVIAGGKGEMDLEDPMMEVS